MIMMNPFKRKIRLARALRNIYDTPDGKIFFEELLRHTGVTQPVFSKDPMEIQWNEGRRHLAMSYLTMISQNDPDSLKGRLEEMKQQENTNDE